MRPALSICIATHNRARFLSETLGSLLPQVARDVEIIIVDGGSTDGTRSLIERLQRTSPTIRYHRQGLNLGVDQGYDTSVDLAQGEYCWLFADDDIAKPGAVEAIRAATRRRPSVVVVNAEVRDLEVKGLLEERKLRQFRDTLYGAGQDEELFVATASYLSYIGGVVVDRALWLARDRTRYFGSRFIHVGVIFQRRLPAETVVLAEPLISIRYGNAMWTPLSFEIWMCKWPALIWSLPFSDEAKSRVWPREPWRALRTLLAFRARGSYALPQYRSFIAKERLSPVARILAIAAALAPGVLVNATLLPYYLRRYNTSRQSIVDLLNSPYYYRTYLGRYARRIAHWISARPRAGADQQASPRDSRGS